LSRKTTIAGGAWGWEFICSMEKKDIGIGFSENPASEEAIKEISLRIKSNLNKSISLAIVFFTPHYKPLTLKETLHITLRPENIFGLQAPLVIFEGRVIKRGVVVCCFSLNGSNLKEILLKESNVEQIESILRKALVAIGEKKEFILCCLSPRVNIHNHLRGFELSLGRGFKIFGGGFIKKYGIKNFQIANNIIDEGASSIILGRPLVADSEKISGFLPVGKTFKITKAAPLRNVILEINNKPASLIYKKYLEEKFETFKKTSLGSLYPIGIKDNGHYRIINVLDFLEDDSLFCIGEMKEGQEGKLMMATSVSLLEAVKQTATRIRFEKDYDLAIVINSFIRRKILGPEADKEIEMIKTILGNRIKIIGFYSDYQIFLDKNIAEFTVENNNLCIVLLKYGRS